MRLIIRDSMECKLSIIMPVYNAELYLDRCLESFLPSLKDDAELIVVNDKSTDNSLDIINEKVKKYSKVNIKVINNSKNMGAGLSRNKALEICNGDYVGFIDADDYVDKNYFYNMLKMAWKEDSDIVVSDIALVNGENVTKNNIYVNNVYSKISNDEVNISKNVLLGNWACASTCSKLFKKEIIKDVFFSEKKSDDILFTIPAIIKANMISYCEGNTYYYFQSNNSLTRNSNYSKYEDGLVCLNEAVNLLYNCDKEWAKVYSANALIPHICYSLNDISLDNVSKFLKIVEDSFKDNDKRLNLFKNNQYIKNNALYNSKLYRYYIKQMINNDYNNIIDKLNEELNIRDKYKVNDSDDNIQTDFNPLVSIVIPVYNGENYLEEAINSALSQTYKNIEIIVVDDGSKDNTEKICKKYKNKIKYIKKENGGVASALNLAIDKMKGEYFSWLSHDDLYFSDKIERQVKYLSSIEDKNAVLFSNYVLINGNGRLIGTPVILNHKMIEEKQEYCLLRGCVNGITMLIPKIAFDKCGKFDIRFRCTQDYDMWHRMLKEFKFVHMEDILSKTRIHALQDTNMSPLAVSEGNVLWIRLIEDVSDKRKIELEGSVFDYYFEMAAHLKYSSYTEAFKWCEDKCKEIDANRYNKKVLKSKEDRDIIKKISYCLNNYGLIETIKIIFKKVFKR